MNLIELEKSDFWRGRDMFATAAWYASKILPPLRRHFERGFRRKQKALFSRIGELVRDAPRPQVNWYRTMSNAAPVGDFFIAQDETAREVKLVNDICTGKTPAELWKGRLTGVFPFKPKSQSSIGYSVIPIAGGQRLVYQGNRPLRWIMLVSKNPLPPIYALEFDYTPHTEFREQLQFDFLMRSLHQRIRFMLRHNERFVFSIIDGGFFAPDSRTVPFSFKMGVTVRVRFEIVRDVFVLIVDGKVVMSVTVPGICGTGKETCALIFYDQEPNVLIDCEIANLIYEESDCER